jgi:hypothetical protein
MMTSKPNNRNKFKVGDKVKLKGFFDRRHYSQAVLGKVMIVQRIAWEHNGIEFPVTAVCRLPNGKEQGFIVEDLALCKKCKEDQSDK